MEISKDSEVTFGNNSGARTFDSQYNMTWIRPDGTTRHFAGEKIARNAYSGPEVDVEYNYDDGTHLVLLKDPKATYISFPSEYRGTKTPEKDVPRQQVYISRMTSKVSFGEHKPGTSSMWADKFHPKTSYDLDQFDH